MLRHPRLASLATREWPAWLWSADGSRILWANAAGAAIFGAETAGAYAKRRFAAGDPPAAQVIRLAATLPSAGLERLERLRGFGGNLGRPLTCLCSRIVADGGKGSVLIAATEAAGPALTLAERVRHLLNDDSGPAAAFVPDGQLIYANAAGQQQLAGASTLTALELDTVAATALENGTAKGTARLNDEAVAVVAAALGQDASRVLVVVMQPPSETIGEATSQAINREPNQKARPLPTSSSVAVATAIGANAAIPPKANVAEAELPPARRHPLRFVWDMDADGHFVIASDEFLQLIGPRAALLGRPWREIAAALNLDPHNQVANAVASHETWSGITVSWPVSLAVSWPASSPAGSGRTSELRLPVELSGLPVFDRDRNFRGYRGFGVCRDLTPMRGLAQPGVGSATAPQLASVDGSAAASPLHAESLNEAELNDAAAAASDDTQEANPALANVVPFRPAAPADPKTTPSLTPVERRAFRELAQELNSRLRAGPAPAAAEVIAEHLAAASQNHAQALSQEELRQVVSQALNQENGDEFGETPSEEASGERGQEQKQEKKQEKKHEATRENKQKQNEEQSQADNGEPTDEHDDASSEEPAEATTLAPGRMIEPALLDRVPVAVLVYRHDELIYANRPFLDLSGYGDLAAIEAAGGLNTLFAEPSDTFADTAGSQTLAIVTQSGERLPVEGRMFTVPWNASPAIALILTKSQSDAASAANAPNPVEALANAKRETERAIATKAEFVARISHEIRNPLNAITGFAEAIMTERFGPIGNERYREYVKDLHAASAHLSSMVDDLFDLSKIESGRIDLTFAKVNLNELTQQCVGIMQPQANRARVIIRSALTSGLPLVDADEKALRQIVLNLLSNSIKFTGPGGQIIVSTVFSDAHEAVLRVRDTGIGMSEKQIEAALAPFPDVSAWASSGSGATGFGLPLTKALTEANHAHFGIKSAPDAGTLIEITFPTNHTAGA